MFIRGGRDADEVITQKIEQQIATLTVQDVKSIDFDQAVNDKLIDIINPMNEFVDSIINFIDIEAIKKANLRVLIDPMFGVAKNALQTVLINGRCDVDVINDGKNLISVV